jgi:hypothetical protein
LYEQLKEQGRLLTEDWRFYDHCTPTFVPQQMSLGELYDGYWGVKKSFYSLPSIFTRLPANMRTPLLFTIANAGLKLGLREERAFIRKRREELGIDMPRAAFPVPEPSP